MKHVYPPSLARLAIGLVLLGLVAAACSPATPTIVAPRPTATTQPTRAVAQPTLAPTRPQPTTAPTKAVATQAATRAVATQAPTRAAATQAPTRAAPTAQPTLAPTRAAPTAQPTQAPTSAAPTAQPTQAPTSAAPTAQPTQAPTRAAPTAQPTKAPTAQPTPQAKALPVPLGFGLCVLPIAPAAASGISGDLRILPTLAVSRPSVGTDRPSAGNVFEVVRIEIENQNGCAVARFDPSLVLLVDPSSGKTFNMITLKSLTGALKAQDVGPSSRITDVVAFEVPATVKDWQLEIKGPDKRDLLWQLNRPEPLGLGQTIGDLLVKPVHAERKMPVGSEKPKQSGDVFELITVDVENRSKTATLHFDPATLLMLDPSSDMGFSMITLPSLANQLQAHELKPGEKVTGVMVYEVPESVTNFQLGIKAADNSELYWRLGG